MSGEGYEIISDTSSTDNDSTGRPPPKTNEPTMEKNNTKKSRKPWVNDIRSDGNKTFLGKVQIRGIRPAAGTTTSKEDESSDDSDSNVGNSGNQTRATKPVTNTPTAGSIPKKQKKKNSIVDSSDNSDSNFLNSANAGSKQNKRRKVERIVDSSDDTDSKVTATSNKGKCLNKSANKEKDGKNSSSASTDCDVNPIQSNKSIKKHKPTKKRNSPSSTKISESSSDTDLSENEGKKQKGKKKHCVTKSTEEKVIIISPEATNTARAGRSAPSKYVEPGKRKRQLSGATDIISRPSSTKKLKCIIEETTEESSDSPWISIQNCEKKNSVDHGVKRKSCKSDDSTTSESEDRKKVKPLYLKKTSSLVLPNINLSQYLSSEEDSDDTVKQASLRVKPIKKDENIEEISDDYPDLDLPLLVRPRKRNNSSNSDCSIMSASTVIYQLSDTGLKEDKIENSFPIEDPEYLNDVDESESEADSDMPLDEIRRKRNLSTETNDSSKTEINSTSKTTESTSRISNTESKPVSTNLNTSKQRSVEDQIIDSDDSPSQLLFTQNEVDKKIKTEEENLSYTVEEDCIFIADSDDDLYSSMSQQNLTINYNDNPVDNNEEELAKFFLGDTEEVETIDVKVKCESPEKTLDFNWFKTSTQTFDEPEIRNENKYDIQTQMGSVIKLEQNDAYDADTQIVVCDDFSDTDDEMYTAQTQHPNNTCVEETKESDSPDSDTQDYYNAATQVHSDSRKNKVTRRKSFDFDQLDDESDLNEKVGFEQKPKIELKSDKNVFDADTQVFGKQKVNKVMRSEQKPGKIREDYLDPYDAATQVNRSNKHSIIRRASDQGPFTIEHTKVETVKVTKQFSSPEEAQKYLEKVKSSASDVFDDDNETQEYEWENEETSKTKKIPIYKRNLEENLKKVKDCDDVYDIMTQIKTDKKEQDLEVIEIDDDDDDDLYNAATQVEHDRKSGKGDYKYKPKGEKISGKGMRKMGSKVKVGVPQKVFDAMTQMEFKSEMIGNYSNVYDAATQVVHDSKQDSDEECYIAETQVGNDYKHDSGSDEELYNAATQAESKLTRISSENSDYTAQTLVDNMEEGTESDSFDYTAQTQVDAEDRTEQDSSDYTAQTLVDNIEEDSCSTSRQVKGNKKGSRNERRNVFTAMTQVENIISDNENEDPYNAQTQVNADILQSFEDDQFGQPTQVDKISEEINDVENRDEDKNKETGEVYEEYVCMLDPEEEGSSEEKSDNNYVPMLDDSPEESSEAPSTSVENKTPKKDKTYVRHTLLKKVSSEEKMTKCIPPQKQKSRKEKNESFKFGKEQFYSKQPKTKTDTKSSDNSDIKMVEDDRWLSKGQRSKEVEKTSKRRTSKDVGVKGTNLSLENKIIEARNRMVQREMENAVHPRPVKRKHSGEAALDVSDVRLPNQKEIIAKGLPLLEFLQGKDNSSQEETGRTSKETSERDKKYSKKESSKDKEENPGSKKSKGSSENKSRDKDRNNKKSEDKDRKSEVKDRKSKEKDKKSEEKERKSEVKRDKKKDKVEDKYKDKKSSSKSREEKDRHDKERSSSRHSSKSSSDGQSKSRKEKETSKNDDKKHRDKENGGRTDISAMKKIPKLSEAQKLDKAEEMPSKSPLLSLDSQMSKSVMSLIGMSSNINTQLKHSQGKSEQNKIENTRTDSTESSGQRDGVHEKIVDKDSVVSETASKNSLHESIQPSTSGSAVRGNLPKSILSKIGTKKKGLNVKFRLPVYSQTAENDRIKNMKKQEAQNEKEIWKNRCFPNGEIPELPFQNKVPAASQQGRQCTEVKPSTSQQKQNNHVSPAIPILHQMMQTLINIPKAGGSPTSDISILDLNYFFVKILKWNANWFDEYEKNRMTPPAIEEAHPVKHLLESYNSYIDYFSTLLPHLIMETWETSVKAWQENKSRHKSVDIAFTRVDKPNDKLFLYTFTAVVPNDSHNLVNEGDLVIVNTWGVSNRQKAQYYPQLGYIERIKYLRQQGHVDTILRTFPFLVQEGRRASSLMGLEISVKTRFRQFKMLSDKRSNIKVVCSLVSTIRHYYALSHLCKTTIWESILKPGVLRVFHNHPSVREEDMADLDEYNAAQKKAICIAAKISLEPAENNRICLIQGPPGTGKSHTIIGIIKKIFKKSNRQCHICLCAPSNAAVDELMKRLIRERRKMEEKSKHSGFRVVRIGKPDNIHMDVQKYTFNEVVKINQAEELKRKMKRHVDSSRVKEIDTLSGRIAALEEELTDKIVKSQNIQADKLRHDISKLKKKKWDMEADIQSQYKNVRLTRDEDEKIKRDVLLRSHIVCGTLNSFGNHYYMNIMSPNVNQIRRSIFQCVIMDEASQATELDTLIPVQYGTTKIIMVGDPEQLPPTVLSQKSANRSYGQSLFERFYNHFRFSDVNPVLLLDTQYRMHPEIAQFPNQYIYDGKIKTDVSAEQRTQKFHLKPYLLFDMQEGQEISTQPGSIINSAEAEFTIELCEFLINRTSLEQRDIGIIAPYQQQKKIIKEGLATSNLQNIEVNTVDSFQGREKEVIMLTCTRAKSSSGGIGFLANKKRMNVALTRAKTALYVVGDLSSLRNGDSAWRTLITDAENRHVIRKVKTGGKYDMVFNTCLLMSARLGRQIVT